MSPCLPLVTCLVFFGGNTLTKGQYSPEAQAVSLASNKAYWLCPADAHTIAAATLRAAATLLRNAYANEECIDSPDDFLDDIATELDDHNIAAKPND